MVFFISKRSVTFQMIRSGMEMLAQSHPLLRMHLIENGDNGRMQFEKSPSLIVDLEERQEKNWITVLEQQSNVFFKHGENLLWLVKYLPEEESDYTNDEYKYQCPLLFKFHHSIVDGMAVMRLVNDMMDNLESQIEERDEQDIISQNVPPSIESITGIDRGLWYYSGIGCLTRFFSKSHPRFILKIIKVVKPNFFKIRPYLDLFISKEKTCITSSPATSLIPIYLDEENTNILLYNCKQNKISPLAALVAAHFIIADKYMSIKEEKIVANISVNVRRLPKFANDLCMQHHCACYVSIIDCILQITPSDKSLWVLARKCQTIIHNNLEKKMYRYLREAVFLSVPHKVFPEPDNHMSILALFNNYGKCTFLDRDQNSPIKLAASQGCPTFHHGKSMLFSITSAMFENKLSWNLTYFTNVTTPKTASDIAHEMNDLLLRSCR